MAGIPAMMSGKLRERIKERQAQNRGGGFQPPGLIFRTPAKSSLHRKGGIQIIR